MPRFLNEMVGWKSEVRARSLRPGPGIVDFDRNAVLDRAHTGQNLPAIAGSFRGVFQQVEQNPFDQVLIADSRGSVPGDRLDRVSDLGMRRFQERNPFFHERVNDRTARGRRAVPTRTGERPDAPLERFDFIDDDSGGLLEDTPGRADPQCDPRVPPFLPQ